MEEKNYLEIIDGYRDEMTAMLAELLAINSVREQQEGEMPFGPGVQQALEYMLEKGREAGFSTKNADNYGGHMEFGGHIYNEEGRLLGVTDEAMGVLVQLDTAPLGRGWEREPPGGETAEGRIYGRGAAGGKGAAVASFYALRAISQAGLEPQKRVRLILGLDGEGDWTGMERYLKRVSPPDFSIAAGDAPFPGAKGEMGQLVFQIAKKFSKTPGGAKGLTFRSMQGGDASNMIPSHAKALLRGPSYDGLKAGLADFKEQTGFHLTAKGRGKSLEIAAEGASAHGSQPDEGQNAISILMQFMERIGFTNEDVCDFIAFYNRCVAFEKNGASMGCGFSDALSGELIFNAGMLEMNEEAARLTVDVRYPLTVTEEEVYRSIMPVINRYNLGVVKLKSREPFYFEEDETPLLEAVEAYRRQTGDEESRAKITARCSYARAVPQAAAFGMAFPEEADSSREKDESLSIDALVMAAKIYADAIAALTRAVPGPAKAWTGSEASMESEAKGVESEAAGVESEAAKHGK